MTSNKRSITLASLAAVAVALLGVALIMMGRDETPLLAEPRPDLDLVLSMMGLGTGLWAAHLLTNAPAARRTPRRWFICLALPLWLGFKLPALGERVQEWLSFRNGGVVEQTDALVAEKHEINRRRNRVGFEIGVISPADKRVVNIRVDKATFEQIRPDLECATLLIERAPNGTVRLLRPLAWRATCERATPPGPPF